MFTKKKFKLQNNYLISENKVDWLIIFLLILFIQITIYQNQFFGIFIGLMIIYVVYCRQSNFKTKMIGSSLMFLSLLLSFFNKSSTIDFFNQIDTWLKFSIYDQTINFINNNQPSQAADFILLTLFNIKQNEAIFFSVF